MVTGMESDYYLRRVVRSTLLRNPAASYDDVLNAWIGARGGSLGESDSERVLVAYENERPGRSDSDRPDREESWARAVGIGFLQVPIGAGVMALGLVIPPLAILSMPLLLVAPWFICRSPTPIELLLSVGLALVNAWVVGLVTTLIFRAVTGFGPKRT